MSEKSDYTYSSFERKEPLESDEWKKSASKKRRKNVKKWCRGIEGREHTLGLEKASWSNGTACFSSTGWRGMCYHHVVCTVCGKQFWGRKFICPERKW